MAEKTNLNDQELEMLSKNGFFLAGSSGEFFEVYENKKLIVEALPSYMFIQPTQPPKPEPEEPEPDKKNDGGDDSNNGGSNNNNNNNDNYGSCPPQVSCGMSLCTYSITPDGECVCRCG